MDFKDRMSAVGTHLKDNWKKYAIGGAGLAGLAGAYHYMGDNDDGDINGAAPQAKPENIFDYHKTNAPGRVRSLASKLANVTKAEPDEPKTYDYTTAAFERLNDMSRPLTKIEPDEPKTYDYTTAAFERLNDMSRPLTKIEPEQNAFNGGMSMEEPTTFSNRYSGMQPTPNLDNNDTGLAQQKVNEVNKDMMERFGGAPKTETTPVAPEEIGRSVETNGYTPPKVPTNSFTERHTQTDTPQPYVSTPRSDQTTIDTKFINDAKVHEENRYNSLNTPSDKWYSGLTQKLVNSTSANGILQPGVENRYSAPEQDQIFNNSIQDVIKDLTSKGIDTKNMGVEEILKINNSLNNQEGYTPIDTIDSFKRHSLENHYNNEAQSVQKGLDWAKRNGASLNFLKDDNYKDDAALFGQLIKQHGGVPKEMEPLLNRLSRDPTFANLLNKQFK